MKPLFVALGIALAVYVGYGIARGELQVKRGIAMECVRRDERPLYFWICAGIYAALALALIFLF